MNLALTFEAEFDRLYQKFAKDPLGIKQLELEGISPNKIDVGQMSHDYFTKRLADVSVDQNANSNEEMSANNYQAEITKGILKLEGYYLLWRYAKKRFGFRRANQLITAIWRGELYFHDSSGHGIQVPYCFAFSTANLMVDGRPYGQLHSLPPKRSDSFVAQVTEVVMDLSQEFAGAVAPGDLIVNLAWYLQKEGRDPEETEDRAYIQNLWQKFVHVANNKFRISGQSPFSNVSIFDRENLKKLFSEYRYPDGTAIDVEYVMAVQKVIAAFFAEGDPKTGLPYRFPVMTVNLSVDENRQPVDHDFLNFISAINVKLGSQNIYANEGSKIAMCPLAKDEEVIIRNFKGLFKVKIGSLGRKEKQTYELLHQGRFVKGRFIEVQSKDFYEITLSNGHKVTVTDNHLNVTQRGTLKTKDLVVGDTLPFNLIPYEGNGGSYDLGYLVGAYLGDGCISNGTAIFSLNNTTKMNVFNKLQTFISEELGGTVHFQDKGNVLNLTTRSSTVKALIREFVIGDGAKNKGINSRALQKSIPFREGLLDGYLATDGGAKERIYTTSKRMVADLSAVAASLGRVTNVKLEDNRSTGYGDSTVYCVKLYDSVGLTTRSYRGVWEKDSNGHQVWFYITDIQPVLKEKVEKAYCFEVDTEEHTFQLANGLITHNCRFVNDTERMTYRADSFGNGGLNIGAHRVVTINFPRIALEAHDRKHFFALLDRRLKMARDLLLVHREEILRRRVDQGFLKFFKPLHWFSLDMLFSTIGIHGQYEMCHFLGLDMETQEGQAFTEEVLKRTEEYAVAFSKETGHSFNTEEIPAESTAITLAKKDRLVFGDKQPFELYSNQYIPLIADMGSIDRIKLTGRFMKHVSGGGILHLNVQERITDPAIMKKLILLSLAEGVEHFAINYGFGICAQGHTSIVGNGTTCPICGEPIVDHLTRVIGYFTKVSSWGDVRKNYEYPKRQFNNVA